MQSAMEQNQPENRQPGKPAARTETAKALQKQAPPGKLMQPKKPRWELTHRIIVTRAKVALLVMLALLVALCGRFAFLQLADPHHYGDAAVEQYTYEVKLPAKRGTIYASDGTTKLAVSATTQTVFISPSDVYKAGTEGTDSKPAPGEDAQIRMIAEGLAECLDDYEASTLIEKYNKLGDAKRRYKYLIVKKNISEEEELRVRAFIADNGLSLQIALEEGTKRYYPYSTLASHLLGFAGSDNTGLGGLEYTYNEYLSGVDGRAVRAQDGNGNQMAYNYASYIEAQDGLNLVTTIDWTLQSIVEKYIKQTYEEHEPEGRVSCIMMNVKTGEILALAIYPDYDLNNFSTLSAEYQKKLDAYTGEDPKAYRSTLLNEMWNNTIASQTYEPGSTFKMFTAAVALETGSVTPSQLFNCGHVKEVNGTKIHCWTSGDHGMQNMAKALVNSCNPALASIGAAVGKERFAEYFKTFGYDQKTGADLVGEVSSIYYETTGVQFDDLSLAVYSFGQTFKITMLQHIAALSAIANGGNLVTPHVAKYLTDQDGKIVKTFSYSPVRQVVSSQVSEEIMSYLVNSTKNANVKGYQVVSKTGTSEKRDTKREDDYVSSCVTFAPAEDPQIAILVTVDTPNNAYGIYGSVVAAPAVSRILTEALPYLGIAPDASQGIVEMVTLTDYRGMTAADAKSAIEALGMKCVVKGEGANVVSQMPRSGAAVAVGGTIVLYTDDTPAQPSVTVPNVLNSKPEAAVSAMLAKGLNVRLIGDNDSDTSDCYIYAQSVDAGESVEPGTVIVLECRYRHVND